MFSPFITSQQIFQSLVLSILLSNAEISSKGSKTTILCNVGLTVKNPDGDVVFNNLTVHQCRVHTSCQTVTFQQSTGGWMTSKKPLPWLPKLKVTKKVRFVKRLLGTFLITQGVFMSCPALLSKIVSKESVKYIFALIVRPVLTSQPPLS